jgi:hypothetical protein
MKTGPSDAGASGVVPVSSSGVLEENARDKPT